MKRLFVILIIFIMIIFSIYAINFRLSKTQRSLNNYNLEYERYLNKTIYGTDLATLINKVININEKNNIEKDKKNYYIENDINSIKIEIVIQITGKTYPMEELYNNNMAEFVKYFNLEEFKCTKIDYHKKSGKVKSMYFEQQ